MYRTGWIDNQLGTGSLLLASYLLVAFGLAMRTYDEGRSSHNGGPVWRVVGLLLCFGWPLLILLVAFEVLRGTERHQGDL